ncbi:MAG: DUF1385 domain-containing protein [Oscillospiraceae bacterium]|nr:DUF1385 domain-containing protein [Oscillospiraceae bacterium]
MNEKEKFKTTIGGQALIEGIYMRGPKKSCISVRKPDGEIYIEAEEIGEAPLKGIPFVRGAVSMVMSLVKGYKSILKSADLSLAEEEEEPRGKFDAWLTSKLSDRVVAAIGLVGAVIGAVLSIMLFIVAPTFLTGLLNRFLPLGGFKALIESVLKMLIFVGYLWLMTRIKDVRRVFEYHGAEHKTIACYEAREELTLENVKGKSRFHPRCGTSFLFLILIISIAIFSFVPFENTLIRAGIKLLLIPVIVGIAYEILRYAGRHSNKLADILSAPGLWMQRLTVFEPDESQIEVAIAALSEVIPEGGEFE